MHQHTPFSAPTSDGVVERVQRSHVVLATWVKLSQRRWFLPVRELVLQFLPFHDQVAIRPDAAFLHNMLRTATRPWRSLVHACVEVYGAPVDPLCWNDGPAVPRLLVGMTPEQLRLDPADVIKFVPLASSLAVEVFLRSREKAPYNGLALAFIALVQRFLRGNKDVRMDALDSVIAQRDIWCARFFFAALGPQVSQLRLRTLRMTAHLAFEPRVAQLVLVALMRQKDRRNSAKELLSGLLGRPDASVFFHKMDAISPLLLSPTLIVDTLAHFATHALGWRAHGPVYDRVTQATMMNAMSHLFALVKGVIDPTTMLGHAETDKPLQFLLLTHLLDGADAVEQETMLGIVFNDATVRFMRENSSTPGVNFNLPSDATPDFACRTWLTFARHAWNVTLHRALENYVRAHGMVEQAQAWLLADERSLPHVSHAAVRKDALRARQMYQ